MTYTARPIAPFNIDILEGGYPASYTVGVKLPCNGTPSNTTATVSSGQVTVYAGSHWRIEYSAAFAGNAVTGYARYEIGLYSITDSQFIGHSLHGTGDGSSYNENRIGRCVATALILDSEISTSKTIEARLISQFDMATPTTNVFGTITFRIMELPA